MLPIWLSAPAGFAADDSPKWICLTERATGFAWNGQRWDQTSFDTSKMRYVISRDPAEDNAYTVKTVSRNYGTRCDGPTEYGFISCPFFGEFKFNTKTLRFLSTYTAGYLDGKENNDNTPAIEIGTCTRF